MFLAKVFGKILGKKYKDDNLKPNKSNIDDSKINESVHNVVYLDHESDIKSNVEYDFNLEEWHFKSDLLNNNDCFEENYLNNQSNELKSNDDYRVEYIDDQQDSFNLNYLNNQANHNFKENYLNNQSNELKSNNDYRVEYIDDQRDSFNLIPEQCQINNNFFNIIDVFTDGSKKRNGLAGSSFTLENHTTGHVVYKIYRLSNYCTSTCSELAAIYQALEFLINNEVSTSFIMIYTDFEHAERFLSDNCKKKILGYKSSKIDLDIFRNLINNLRSAKNMVIIKWIKKDSHVLNQYADLFAKRGSRLNKINFNVSLIQSKKKEI